MYAVTALLEGGTYVLETPGAHHDPHVWMDASGWMKAAETIADKLVEKLPAQATAIRGAGNGIPCGIDEAR